MKIIKHPLPNHLNLDSAPSVISPTATNEKAPLDEIVSWLSEERLNLEKELQRTGAILLRSFENIRGAEAFEAIVLAISPEHSTDEGSTSPRTLVGKRIESFENKGVRLRRRLPKVNLTGNKAIRTWREVFETDSQSEVERIVAELGWELRWYQSYLGSDSYVEIYNPICPPSISHPTTGERVWFNQAHVLHKSNFLYWAKQYGGFKLWGTALVAPILEHFFYYHHVYGDDSEISNSDLITHSFPCKSEHAL